MTEENHKRAKRRRMASADALLKKSPEQEAVLAELAAEAAAIASSRSEQIREETKRLLENRAAMEAAASPKMVVKGSVAAADIHDITQRDVKKLDFQDRLPWLKQPASRAGHKEGQDEVDGETEPMTSPGSGLLSDGASSPLGTATAMTSTDPLLSRLQNGTSKQLDQLPELPPKDYPLQLPPIDYPRLSPALDRQTPKMKQNLMALSNPIGDDQDYYALMNNGLLPT